ncbi:MAG: FKBP-type peptidyl-prolyl cis-trans isomerase [Candidatus Amulumruptor caecigallinarius]|nr:FKBP-type peptidyl-prolyl cis-trans isomerase [Candidatus Amulumruptor caecigallinarius]
MNKTVLPLAAALMVVMLPSCLDDSPETYDDWRQENETYLENINTQEYTRVSPDWAPQNAVYIKWHNDRSSTADNLVAISNSTVDIIYEMEDIKGNKLGNSYYATTGDSVYQSRPNANITGMWIAMTTMHVGDSATVIIPYSSAYGSTARGKILPFSNLIYHMKIKSIPAYERP